MNIYMNTYIYIYIYIYSSFLQQNVYWEPPTHQALHVALGTHGDAKDSVLFC